MSNIPPMRIVELAWRTTWPTWTHDLDFRPENLWPKIAALAIEWERRGLSEAEMMAEQCAAASRADAEIRRRIAELKPVSSSTKAANTAALLASLNLGAKT